MNDETEFTVCPKCSVIITLGMWPFCPHPAANTAMIIRDEIPGGITLENYGPNPVTFHSYSEIHAYHKANGLQLKEKFCPAPGTDIDPQGIPNPAGYVDAYTLAAGAELMCRNGAKKDPEWDGVEAGVLRDVQVGHITERDAQAIADGDKGRMSRFHRRTSS